MRIDLKRLVFLVVLAIAPGHLVLAQDAKPDKPAPDEKPVKTEITETTQDKTGEKSGENAVDPETGKKVHPFSTDKNGVPIDKFIEYASQALDIAFVWSPLARNQVKTGQKSIIVTQEMKIPHESLLDFVRTNLRVHDLALVDVGPPEARFILIELITQPTILKSHRQFVPADELEKYKNSYIPIVTTLHVEHVNVQQIQTQIQRLSAHQQPGSQIIPAPSENAFIIMDFAPDAYNMARLIQEMDKQGVRFDQTLEIIQLEFASAAEVEAMLSEILQEEGGGGIGRQAQPGIPQGYGGPRQPPPPKIIPDERANRLVIYATPEDHKKILDLVKDLDVDVPASTGNITVHPLKNTVAEEIVETLKEIMEGTGGSSRRPGGPGGGPSQGSMSTRTGGDKVDIVADKSANALLIRGTKSRVQEVIEIIKQLDIRKPQVLVEAAILELQHDNTLNLGVELGAFDAKSDLSQTFRPFGYTSLGLSALSITENGIYRVPNLGNQGIVGGIFNGDGFLFPVLIRAFEDKGYTNLLSMPSILTNDNTEASIKVSRSVATTQLNQGTPGQISTQTFGEYQEAPIELTISPHIASDDYLRLDITFLVEVFGAGGGPGIPPPKTSREINTAVTVPNGATVVIGGLTLDDQQETTRQVPILGDIPIVGVLFRSTETRHTKNTLFLFLTPRILSDPQFRDLDEYSTQKKAEIAKLNGQIDLVDPEFGDRYRMLEKAKSIQDLEASGEFDMPVIHSPSDAESRTAKKSGAALPPTEKTGASEKSGEGAKATKPPETGGDQDPGKKPDPFPEPDKPVKGVDPDGK